MSMTGGQSGGKPRVKGFAGFFRAIAQRNSKQRQGMGIPAKVEHMARPIDMPVRQSPMPSQVPQIQPDIKSTGMIDPVKVSAPPIFQASNTVKQPNMYGQTPPIFQQEPVRIDQDPTSKMPPTIPSPMMAPPVRMAPVRGGGFSGMMEAREDGGPVRKKRPYLVGENGPEIIVPQQDGYVIPNDSLEEEFRPPMPAVTEDPAIGRIMAPPVQTNVPLGGPNAPQGSNTAVPLGGQNIQQEPEPVDPYKQAMDRYQAALAQEEKAPGKGTQALYYALQGLKKFAYAAQGNPDTTPIEPLQDIRKRNRIAKAGQEFKPYADEKARQIKTAQDEAKIKGDTYDNIQKRIKGIQSMNPIFGSQLEEAVKNGVVTPEMAKKASNMGYGEVLPGDYQDYKILEVGGKQLATPTKGKPNFQETNAPVDQTKSPIGRTLRDGTPYFTTGDKAANNEAMEAYRQAQLDMQAGKYNQDRLDEYADKLQEWAEKNDKRGLEITTATEEGVSNFNLAKAKEKEASAKEARALEIRNNPRFDRDPDLQKQYSGLMEDVGKLKTEAITYQGKADEAIRRGKDLGSKSIPKPTKPSSTLESPNISPGATVTKAQLKKMNETIKASGKKSQYSSAEEWAKAKGMRIIE